MLIPYSKNSPEVRTSSAALYTTDGDNAEALTEQEFFQHTLANVFNGFKQPGWRSLIKEKRNATTPCSGSKATIESSYSSASVTILSGGKPVRRRAIGSLAERLAIQAELLPSLDGTAPLAELNNTALLEFLKRCKSAQRQFSSGVFVGELRETLQLIRNPAASFRRLLSEYVGKCRRNALRLTKREKAKHVANQWLEYSFGIVPLISDVEDGIKALERLSRNSEFKNVKFEAGRDYYGTSDTQNSDIWSGLIPCRINRRAARRVIKRITGQVRLAQRGIKTDFAVRQTIGATVRDFVPTIYELIPYSFLVDYFVNIGELLEVGSFCQSDLVWHCETLRYEDERSLELVPKRPATLFGLPVLDYDCGLGRYSRKDVTFVRSSNPLGLPSLVFKIPDAPKQLLNIAALAAMRVL